MGWRKIPQRNKGFTFIEIMLVVLIIGILMAVVMPRFIGQGKNAKLVATRQTIENTRTALRMFETSVGRFPTTQEGLAALVERPTNLTEDEWKYKYLDQRPRDAWKQELIYKSPGDRNQDFDIYSKGPDRQEGTDDDVYSELETAVAEAGH